MYILQYKLSINIHHSCIKTAFSVFGSCGTRSVVCACVCTVTLITTRLLQAFTPASRTIRQHHQTSFTSGNTRTHCLPMISLLHCLIPDSTWSLEVKEKWPEKMFQMQILKRLLQKRIKYAVKTPLRRSLRFNGHFTVMGYLSN